MKVNVKHLRVCNTLHVGWTFPNANYMKFNVDGSVINNGVGACGGVLRDECGKWVMGFTQHLGC